MARLTTPTYDGSTDPTLWIYRMQLLFKLQCLPTDQHIRYAAFHMTGVAYLWYIRVTKEKLFSNWDTFSRDLTRDFSPPLSLGTLGDLAPPRHEGDLNDYTNNFDAYVLRTGIASELHQVHLFITGLKDEL
jgi:hypothetical protein